MKGRDHVLSSAQFERAVVLFRRRWGMRLHAGNREAIERAMQVTATRAEQKPEALLDLIELRPDAALVQELIERCTIGETYFFRHPEDFAALRNFALPAVRALHPERVVLRGWSAGCATGEEAYSLAATLLESSAGRRVTVLATDVNQLSLEKARAGSYGAWSDRGQANPWRGLVTSDGAQTLVSPALRTCVKFAPMNLADLRFPSPFNGTEELDIIFCRNVLVYFAPDAAAAVLTCMAECLVPGGFMFVSALDVDLAPKGLIRQTLDNVVALQRPYASAVEVSHKATRQPTTAKPAVAPSKQLDPVLEAQFLADAGQVDRAIRILRQSMKVERSTHGLLLLGVLLWDRGDLEAGDLLREVVQREPDNVLARLHLGIFLHTRGDNSHAYRQFKCVLDALSNRGDDEMVTGLTPIAVGYVRRLVRERLRTGMQR